MSEHKESEFFSKVVLKISWIFIIKLRIKSVFFTIIFLSASLSFVLAVPKIQFKQLTVNDGLSHSQVYSICQDQQGFLWFGTNEGLNKYDGYNIIVYKGGMEDSTGFTGRGIKGLLTDSKGDVWLAGVDGLYFYNQDEDRLEEVRYNHNKSTFDYVVALCEDKKGNLWFGSKDTLFSLDIRTHEILSLKKLPLPVDNKEINIQCIYEDSRDNLWIGSTGIGLLLYDRKNGNFKQFRNNPDDPGSISGTRVESIYEDSKGNLWIGTLDHGVNLYNYEDSSFTQIIIDENESFSHRVRSIVEDKDQNLWFGTRSGLYRKDKISDKFYRYAYMDDDYASLSHNSVFKIFFDSQEIMWVGTYAGGVNYADFRQKPIAHYFRKSNNDNFLNNSVVQAIIEDKGKNLWIGTEGGGLNYLDHKTNRFTYFMIDPNDPGSIRSNNIKALVLDDQNNLWIGTYQGGLEYFNTKTRTFIHYRHDPADTNSIYDNRIYSLHIDSKQNMWIGTARGMDLLKKGEKHFRHFKEFSGSGYRIQTIYEDKNHFVWIGTFDKGLYVYTPKTGKIEKFKGDIFCPLVEVINEDSEGNIWIGGSNGLFCIQKGKEDIVQHINVGNGRNLNTICGILEDENKNLWLGTSSFGLVKFNNAVSNPGSTSFRIYETTDGIQSKEFNSACYKSVTGEMFFGGVNGFNTFFPEAIRDNPYKPFVVLTNLKIFNESVPIGKKIRNRVVLEKSISQLSELVLSYKENVFTFEFSAIHNANPERNHYAYIMEGFEEEWNFVGTQRTATYTNIDPGEYVFRVKASNNDGIWNEEGISLRIIILPPWWETWYFKVTGLIVIAGFLVSLYLVRIKIIKRQNLALEVQVKEKTQDLSRMNDELKQFAYIVSHDLKAPLRGIASLAGWIEEDLGADINEGVKENVTLLQDRVGRMERLINGILDYSRVGRMNTEKETIDSREVVEDVIKILNIPEGFSIAVVGEFLKIYSNKIWLEQVFTNLLSNAIKYHDKEQGNITIGYDQDDHFHIFSVKDDGPGIAKEYQEQIFVIFQMLQSKDNTDSTGIGLTIVKKIIEEQGGKVWVESDGASGSKFIFTIPK